MVEGSGSGSVPGGLKTYGSYEFRSGSTTLGVTVVNQSNRRHRLWVNELCCTYTVPYKNNIKQALHPRTVCTVPVLGYLLTSDVLRILGLFQWLEGVRMNDCVLPVPAVTSAGILEQSMGARNRVGIGLSYWPASCTGWQNRFLGIDSWAP